MALRKVLFTATLGMATLLVTVPAAHAIDGVLEINDASILAAGGYPFMIGAPGSYVLTGDLAAPPGMGALVVGVPNVEIDLNGFTITGGGPPLAAGITTAAAGVTVRGGSVSGFSGIGIVGGPDFRLFETRVTGNAAGVVAGFNCLIVENVISGNAGIGLDVQRCKVENNVIRDNDDTGITGANNVIVHNVINANGLVLGGGGVLTFMGSTIQENEINDNLGFGVSDTPGAPPGPVPAPPGFPFPPAPFPGMPPQVVMKNVIDGSLGGIGVFFFNSAVVTGNRVNNQAFDGIVCGGGCTVRDNGVANNNLGGAGNGGITVGPGSAVNNNSLSFNFGIGAVLDPTAGYTNNTLAGNTIQDMSLFVPAAPLAPHPTSGFANLCSGVPGPAPGLCP